MLEIGTVKRSCKDTVKLQTMVLSNPFQRVRVKTSLPSSKAPRFVCLFLGFSPTV